MAFERAFIDINIAVDLDSVAGNFDKAEDFVTFIEQTIKNAIPHYKPEVIAQRMVTKPYVWSDEKMEYIQPKLVDDVREPKIGDKTFELGDGEGGIICTSSGDYLLDIQLVAGDTVSVEKPDLTWVESENRWEYGDLERK